MNCRTAAISYGSMGQAICYFLDRNPFHKPDATGFNRVGYSTERETMIYQRDHRFVEVPLKTLRPKRLEAHKIKGSESELSAIETFFTGNVPNTFLMNRGLRAVAQGPRSLFDSPIKLPILNSITESERVQRWQKLPDVLQELDLIQVFDESSRISRVIAAVDRGTWSHSAMYSGHGTVIEAITSGVTERPIDVYRRQGIRIGVYRVPGVLDGAKSEDAITHARKQIGRGYGWLTLLKKGTQLLLHLDSRPERFIPSPNDLIVRTEGIKLVFLV